LNKIILIGRATKDFELKYTPNGVGVASGTIAVDRQVAQGKDKEADFINLVAWKQLAETCANYIKKGHRFGLEGRLQIRNYDNSEGKKVWVPEVIVERVEFLEPAQKKEEQPAGNKSSTRGQGQSQAYDVDDSDLPS
jgi:single-strand DNA-binding protein